LAPSLTEMLFAIGAGSNVVGRTEYCNYPAAVSNCAVVGQFGRPTLEGIAAMQPTHVWYVAIENRAMGENFAKLGWQGGQIACARIGDIPVALEALGAATGHRAEAHALAATLQEGFEVRRAAAQQRTHRPTVLVVLAWEPLLTVGGHSFIADIVELAGGELITANFPREYFTVSEEWVLKQNPQVIVCLDGMVATAAIKKLRQRLGWKLLPAVTEDRVYDQFDLDIMCRPGPRILQAIDDLRQVLQF